jgi:hypothetical protein
MKKMNKSIDDEPPEAWSRINKWHRNGPDQHPLFPTKDQPEMPEAKMTSSYTRQGYKFKTSWGDEDVNSPTHYAAQGDIECIDAMESMMTTEEVIGYLRGNSFKYRWRCRDKNNAVKDLLKAQWYENRLLELLKAQETLDDK